MKKSLISLLLIGLLAFGAGAGTFAWFTSEATSAGNVFDAGTLTIDNPGDGAMVSTVANVANAFPGWSGSKTITVTNSGSLDFQFRLDSITEAAGSDSVLFDGADGLEVSVDGGANYFPVNTFAGTDSLGTIAAGQTGTFDILYRLPNTADNTYQDAVTTLEFNFLATQGANTTWAE